MPSGITLSMNPYLVAASRKMYKALREINEATNLKAQDVNFTESDPMAEWICWAIDTAGTALEKPTDEEVENIRRENENY